MQALRFYDFFAGVGMVDLALASDWECIWANDIDPKKAAIYRANHNPDRFHLGDIANVTARDLPPGADLAWASFPCQDLSLAGWGRGMTAERSGTFWQFYRIMSELHQEGRRPRMIVLENVVGLLRGADFGSLCAALDSLGMQYGALVIDASHFVPQSRPRVFVVAVDREVDCQAWTCKSPGEAWNPPSLIEAHRKLSSRLLRNWLWWKLPKPAEAVPSVGSLIEDCPNGVRWNSDEETARLLGMMSPVNLEKVERAIERGEKAVGFLYKRTRGGQQRAEVRFDGIAGCLRTPTGGSSRQTLVIVEDGRIRTRLISPREAARLMGVGESFKLPDAYNDAYHAMGDGVAVPVVRWLSRGLLNPLALASSERDSGPILRYPNRRAVAAQLALAEDVAAIWQ